MLYISENYKVFPWHNKYHVCIQFMNDTKQNVKFGEGTIIGTAKKSSLQRRQESLELRSSTEDCAGHGVQSNTLRGWKQYTEDMQRVP